MAEDEAKRVGEIVGRAIARDVLAEPDWPREWCGLNGEDGDQITEAGILPDTPEWYVAIEAARKAYETALREDE